ncbi:MAG TPA: hypothetical protein VLL52_21160 [Anaerolineae bacterium]|nr:hypothetical protein [Anaerolineae bacterium]
MTTTTSNQRPPYLWDYNIDNQTFQAILAGKQTVGRLDQDWATIRLLEYGTYPEIIELIGFPALVEGWPRWREHVRAPSRQRGFDFLVDWLKQNPSRLDVHG